MGPENYLMVASGATGDIKLLPNYSQGGRWGRATLISAADIAGYTGILHGYFFTARYL
jgi:hypothetical protein